MRIKLGEAIFPIHMETTTSEVKFTKSLPPGLGFAFADGAFDAKPVLNELVHKGYIPMVKPSKMSPSGYGARIRNRIFNHSLYKLRYIGEGFFGALTVEFGDRLKTRRRESTETRILLRITVYCLKNTCQMALLINY